MKSLLLIALAALAVRAQRAPGIPECAVACLNNAVASTTSCAATDYVCICDAANYSRIQAASTDCIISACGTDVALNQVLPATQALCVNPETAVPVDATSSAPAGSSSSTSRPSTTSTRSPTTTTPGATDNSDNGATALGRANGAVVVGLLAVAMGALAVL